MIELDSKYVFHIPLYRYDGDKLAEIDIGEVLDELIIQFNERGFESLYVTKVKGHYRSRCFDELLLTIFSSSDENPEEIFIDWFERNNDVLGQEAFGWECGNRMFICELD